MWKYSEKLMDHFKNPRNVGVIDDPDGVGEVGSIACGDALRLMFKLDENGRIKDAKFQTFGCASAIASSSALTEMIKGKTLDEAKKITNKDIADYLGGLPDQKMHCSVMGRDALLAAIENYEKGTPPDKKVDSEIVCQCFGVTRLEIEKAIVENNLNSVEEITNYTKAGGGCGNCIPDLQAILDDVLEKRRAECPPQKQRSRLTNIQKIKLIEDTLEREIRPALKKDGGDVELVDVDGNKVIVSLRGTCSSCLVSHVTLKNFVEAKLREFVSDELEVVEDRVAEAG